MKGGENMTKVLWCSRHKLTEDQLDGLKRVLKVDTIDVIQYDATIKSAQDLISRLDDGFVAIAAVLPVQLLSDLKAATNIQVLVPVNKRVPDGNGGYQFVYGGWDLVEVCQYKATHLF